MSELIRDKDEVQYVHDVLSTALLPVFATEISEAHRLMLGMRAMTCWLLGHSHASDGVDHMVNAIVAMVSEKTGIPSDTMAEMIRALSDEEDDPWNGFDVDDLDWSEL